MFPRRGSIRDRKQSCQRHFLTASLGPTSDFNCCSFKQAWTASGWGSSALLLGEWKALKRTCTTFYFLLSFDKWKEVSVAWLLSYWKGESMIKGYSMLKFYISPAPKLSSFQTPLSKTAGRQLPIAEILTETQVSQQWEDTFFVAKAMFLINVVNDACVWEPVLAKPSNGICVAKPNLIYCSGSK